MNIPDPNGIIPGGPWTPNPKGRPGEYLGPKPPKGPRPQLQYVPDEKNGGPRGARKPYWKVKQPGQKGWQRYNECGKPISPEQAHPKPRPRTPPFLRPKPPVVWWCIILCPTPAY